MKSSGEIFGLFNPRLRSVQDHAWKNTKCPAALAHDMRGSLHPQICFQITTWSLWVVIIGTTNIHRKYLFTSRCSKWSSIFKMNLFSKDLTFTLEFSKEFELWVVRRGASRWEALQPCQTVQCWGKGGCDENGNGEGQILQCYQFETLPDTSWHWSTACKYMIRILAEFYQVDKTSCYVSILKSA